jgi:starch-binding outer membrane protein, SusD/RagB family
MTIRSEISKPTTPLSISPYKLPVMKTLKYISMMLFAITACRDELEILNPNEPTPESARNENGIIALAQGGVYINGLRGSKFGGNLMTLVFGYHERMGDIILSSVANGYIDRLGCPDSITLDNGRILTSMNINGHAAFLRDINVPSTQNNPFYYEWSFMYAMNGVMNRVLDNLPLIEMSEEKKNTVKAWAYFWKGYAYSRIGSMYYAGIINDKTENTNGLYVTKEQLLEEAEKNFGLAATLIVNLNDHKDYLYTLDKLIPSLCKPGKGGAMTSQEWVRHINTFRARNLLVNTPVNSMTPQQWEMVLELTSNGVRKQDNTFTIRTDALGNLLPAFGYVASQTIGNASNGGGGNKISERFIQEFKPGDQRLANNFNKISPWVGPPQYGTSFNTRYVAVDKGKGMPGVLVYVNRSVGAQELYLSATYEENLLMQAESNIYLGNIEAGLALIDELRNYQGAGLTPVAGKGLTLAEAKEELRRERRVALAFYGFAFYDARRWGVLENGRTGCVVIDFDGSVHTNATIHYGYLDYWDVPIAELFYNPPAQGSAPVVNPKN